MGIVSIIKLLLSIAAFVAQYAHDKKLMDAGAAQAVLRSLKEADDAVAKANVARANANSVPVESDPDNRNR